VGIGEFLANYRRIAMDTNLFIYAFEQHPDYGETVKALLDEVEGGTIEAIVQ
jgi:predicted nucleic acid-binding protein